MGWGISFEQADQGWCPNCQRYFPLINHDKEGRPACFYCGHHRDDDLIQIGPLTFRCSRCNMRFSVTPGKNPLCLNCGRGVA